MATTKEDVLEFISNMSVLELAELVKEFEEKFRVSETPISITLKEVMFDVVLKDAGENKKDVKAAIVELTGLDKKEVKGLIKQENPIILVKVTKIKAMNAKTKIEEAGATVSVETKERKHEPSENKKN